MKVIYKSEARPVVGKIGLFRDLLINVLMKPSREANFIAGVMNSQFNIHPLAVEPREYPKIPSGIHAVTIGKEFHVEGSLMAFEPTPHKFAKYYGNDTAQVLSRYVRHIKPMPIMWWRELISLPIEKALENDALRGITVPNQRVTNKYQRNLREDLQHSVRIPYLLVEPTSQGSMVKMIYG